MITAFYFPHNQNARSNNKITALIFKHQWAGYGIYWAIIEKLYENNGVLDLDYERIAFDLRTDPVMIESIVSDFGLFQTHEKTFTCKRVRINISERKSKSDKARESAEARWGKGKRQHANALRTECDSNAKEKRREEDRKEEKTTTTFDGFWNEYPKKVGRGAAEKSWKKIKSPSSTLVEILKALAWQKVSEQWTKDGGQFIPNPATYLNQRRWEDEKQQKVLSAREQRVLKAINS